MMFSINIPELLRTHYPQLTAKIAELDQRLALQYGDRYHEIKEKLSNVKAWYITSKAEAESSGVIPLEQKQEDTNRQLAEAGAAAARKEEAIQQQLKDLWHARKLS